MSTVEERNLYDGVPSGVEGGTRFVIDRRDQSIEDHDLWINGDRDSGHYVNLGRGILDDFSRGSVEAMVEGLNALTQGRANYYMEEQGIRYEELAIALRSAKIAEVEGLLRASFAEVRKLKDTVNILEENPRVGP